VPGRQRRAVRAEGRDLWPMARRGHCQLRVFVRGRRGLHEGRRFRAVDCGHHAGQLAPGICCFRFE